MKTVYHKVASEPDGEYWRITVLIRQEREGFFDKLFRRKETSVKIVCHGRDEFWHRWPSLIRCPPDMEYWLKQRADVLEHVRRRNGFFASGSASNRKAAKAKPRPAAGLRAEEDHEDRD